MGGTAGSRVLLGCCTVLLRTAGGGGQGRLRCHCGRRAAGVPAGVMKIVCKENPSVRSTSFHLIIMTTVLRFWQGVAYIFMAK